MVKLIALLFLLTGCGDSLDTYSSSVSNSSMTPPFGWSHFCEEYNCPSETIMGLGDLKKILDPLVKNFVYKKDEKESWDILKDGNLQGDCEDFALTLRYKLIQSGFHKSYVRIATCYLDNEYHTVAIVELNGGQWYVCDRLGVYEFQAYNVEWEGILDETGAYWVRLNSNL